MATTCYLSVISMKQQIFSGLVKKIHITGSEGELGLLPSHAPLLTCIKPGMVYIVKQYDEKEWIYLSGGVLEVRPSAFTVLADTAIRGVDLDKERALHAKRKAEECVCNPQSDLEHDLAISKLEKSIAKLRVIELTRNAM